MNLSLDAILNNGLLFDVCGLIGLSLIALAAIKLARRYRSWGGTMMAAGAICLLIGRIFLLLAPHVIDDKFLYAAGPIGIGLTIALPPLLLSFGLAGVVWGLWGHERWLNEESH